MSARSVLSDEDVAAAVAAFASGWLTMGPRIQAFEAAFAEELGVAHAVAVSNVSTALHLAVSAAGAKPGTSVVVSALADVEAVCAPRYAGARPLRADLEAPDEPALTPAGAEAVAGEDTVALIASHLAGTPADVAGLRELCDRRGWKLIEDASHALGAELAGGRPAGTAGDLGCFSFAPGSVIGVGEGGMVVSDDEALATRVRSLRSHAMTSVTWDRHRGHADSYDVTDVGYNARMDEPRAGLAASRLGRLGTLVAERRELAAALGGAPQAPGAAPQYAVLPAGSAEEREALAKRLSEAGVPVTSWPDGWTGVADAAPAPNADLARAQTVLVDLGEAIGLGLGAERLRTVLAGAV